MGERDIPATGDCAQGRRGRSVRILLREHPEEARTLTDRSARPPSRQDAHAPRFEAIPKPSGGVRWLTRLDPADLARYEAAVRPLVGGIERTLGPEVFAIRAGRWRQGWRVAPWRPARRAWRRAVRTAVAGARARTVFAVADVAECYGSISPEAVRAVLGSDADELVRLLAHLQDLGVRGLPIGPDPSAFVANAVLARLDETLRRAGVDHVRWVDDVIAWGAPDDLRRALDRLVGSGEALGLALHDRKTRTLQDRDEAQSLTLGDRDSSIIAAP